MPREQAPQLRLGVRGDIRGGLHSGSRILIDSAGPTPVDPLVVIVSPDLDVQGHPHEEVLRIWPADIGELLVAWAVQWTRVVDDQVVDRFVAGLPVLTIDGAHFDDFEGFVDCFSALLDEFEWRGSLDAFNDILRGGCGTPDGGFELRWVNSQRSRDALGWPATIHWLEANVTRCHPSNVPTRTAALEAARRGEGTTLFDWVVEIVKRHGPGGSEAEDNVVLRLL